jgi:hypothetical protein
LVGGPKTEKAVLDKGLNLGDANSAYEGVKKEGIIKCTKVVRRQVSTV